MSDPLSVQVKCIAQFNEENIRLLLEPLANKFKEVWNRHDSDAIHKEGQVDRLDIDAILSRVRSKEYEHVYSDATPLPLIEHVCVISPFTKINSTIIIATDEPGTITLSINTWTKRITSEKSWPQNAAILLEYLDAVKDVFPIKEVEISEEILHAAEQAKKT